jgi:hypothetical protein
MKLAVGVLQNAVQHALIFLQIVSVTVTLFQRAQVNFSLYSQYFMTDLGIST